MKKSHLLSLLSLLLLSGMMTSCFIDLDDDDGFFDCIDGDGPLVETELFLDPIDGIDLELPVKVVLTQGPEQIIVVRGKQNIINELDLDVRNGIWDIEVDDCVSDLGNMTFFITLPNIRVLRISGSGEIISPDILLVDDLDLSIAGSGDMDLGLNADDIDMNIAGSGEIVLEGIADDLDFDVSGSGDYRGFGLECNTAFIRIAGSGDADVRVLDELIVRISGSGDVRFRGNPALDIQVSGSGEVIDAN